MALVSAYGSGGAQSPFTFGVGARNLALGGAVITDCEPATASFWNPSTLAYAERYSITGFHTQLFDKDVTYQYLGLALPTLDIGAFGIGIARLGVNNIEKRDDGNLLLGSFDDSRIGFYAAYGRYFGNFAMGIAVNIENHSLDSYKATSTPGVSLSLARRFNGFGGIFHGERFGLVVSNIIQPKMKLDRESSLFPRAVDFGIEFEILPNGGNTHSLMASARLGMAEDDDKRTAFGMEYNLVDILHLRAGLRDGKESFGAGVSHRWMNFDYAFVNRELGSLHMFSLSFDFGHQMSERRTMREQRRENEFQQRMTNTLMMQNRKTSDSLMEIGKNLLEQGDLEQTVIYFDRANFIGAGSGLDTAATAAASKDAHDRLDYALSIKRFREYIDSALANYDQGELVTARSFAGLALNESPGSIEAKALIEEIDESLRKTTEISILIESGIRRIDSLIEYGKVNQAFEAALSLQKIDSNSETIKKTMRRAQFEKLKHEAVAYLANGEIDAAKKAVEFGEELFPGHQWCKEMLVKIAEESSVVNSLVIPEPKSAPQPNLSASIMEEIKRKYETGRQAFDGGDLGKAVGEWEAVAKLSPDYQSVKQYLVTAYRFMGVEFYSRNELKAALDIWQRAAKLDPANNEIKSYIRRTEGEIKKLQEYSYDR
jgi:tetratricopeptide (TPR) repeat protein